MATLPLHTPVLLQEAIAALNLRPGVRVIDATLGLGGHAEEVLRQIGKAGRLLAIDQDPLALERARERLQPFRDQVRFVQGRFDQLQEFAEDANMIPVDAILADLGISSLQLEDPARGFSFQHDGPLDMRMDPEQALTAADIVNDTECAELEKIFREYGEEIRARSIAKHICFYRKQTRIETTGQLRQIIESVVPRKTHRIHPATKVFQALRIKTNDELGTIARMLDKTSNILAPGGRLVVISFHSLEDRIIKQFLREKAKDCVCPPLNPICICSARANWRILTKKPIVPTLEETERNPRARSAKMRVGVFLGN